MTQSRPPRATKAEHQRRIQDVFRKLIMGYTTSAIITSCQEENGVSERQAWRYIAAARQQFADVAAQDRAVQVGIALERLSLLFNLAARYDHLAIGLEIVREQNHLMLNLPPAENDSRLRHARARVTTPTFFEKHGGRSLENEDSPSIIIRPRRR